MRDVIVIEAPGKIESFKRAIGDELVVMATRGHFMRYPRELVPIGISWDENGHIRERLRLPAGEISAQLAALAADSGTVYLATDADDEGDAIAADVSALLRAAPAQITNTVLRRTFIRSLEPDDIREALAEALPISTNANPGAAAGARRILDRLVGATFSGRNQAGETIGAGRVLSAMLGAIHSDQAGPPASESHCLPQPWNYADALMGAGEYLHLPLRQAALGYQRLYEHGLITYPRTTSHGYTPKGRQALVDALTARAKKPTDRRTSGRTGWSGLSGTANLMRDPGHEALRPTRMGMAHASMCEDLTTIYRDAGEEAALLALLARATACAASGRTMALNPRGTTLETMCLAVLCENGLGRPSTIVDHVARAVERRLVETRLGRPALTARGKLWLEGSPGWLRHPEFSRQIEEYIDAYAKAGRRGEEIARIVIDKLPATDRGRILGMVEDPRDLAAAEAATVSAENRRIARAAKLKQVA